MKTSNSASLIAGLLVAALGLLPLLFIMRGANQEAAPVSTSTTEKQPNVTLVEVDPPQIGDLDPRLTRVLYAYDAASGIAPGASQELPDEIVRVLSFYDVTLSVESGGGQ